MSVALDYIRMTGPDLTVVDVTYLNPTRFEAYRRLRADPWSTGVPIIVVSGALIEETVC